MTAGEAPITYVVVEHQDAAEFAEVFWPLAATDAERFTILATALDSHIRGIRRYPEAQWFTLHESQTDGPAGVAVAAAMCTPTWGLHLPPAPLVAIDTLVSWWSANGYQPPELSGHRPTAEHAATRFCSGTPGLVAREDVAERLYRLGTRVQARPTDGKPRLATALDFDLLRTFMIAFSHDAGLRPLDPTDPINARLKGGAFVLWEVDGQPVSLAGVGPAACGVARVGPVYTPTEFRGRGYASAATQAVTDIGFERGASSVVLFTDLANPTSNSIYQAIGYEPIADFVEIKLEQPPPIVDSAR